MIWKIWFTDGESYSSADGKPENAPLKDVAIIHVADGRCGRRVLKYQDWYRWCPKANRWFDGTEFDVLYHLVRNGSIIARRGGYMPEHDFERLLILSHEDRFVQPISPKEPPHIAWKE